MDVTAEQSIPDKLYFRIGEVAKLIGVKPYVLRYWETEFSEISPVKSKTKQRLYKRQDVELILRIRDLLYNRKFTIQGAKKIINENKKVLSHKQITLGLSLDEDHKITGATRAALDGVLADMDDFINS